MSEGSSVAPFFTFLAVLLYFLLTNRGKKKKQDARRSVPPKQVSRAPLQKKPVLRQSFSKRKEDLAYKVEKKTTTSFLKKEWQDKDSLKKAFILSEVLKRVDERDPF